MRNLEVGEIFLNLLQLEHIGLVELIGFLNDIEELRSVHRLGFGFKIAKLPVGDRVGENILNDHFKYLLYELVFDIQ